MNLNDFIKVKLTPRGERIHFDYYYKYLPRFSSAELCFPTKDKEGFTKYMLWEFAHIFGEHLYNGAEQLIQKNEVIIVDNK